MGKLRVCSGKEICRILTNVGFTEVRKRGSHIVMQKNSPKQRLQYQYRIIKKLKLEHCFQLFVNLVFHDLNLNEAILTSDISHDLASS